MKINLDPVVDEPFVWQETLRLASGELDLPEVQAFQDVSCRGRIRPLATGYLFEISLSYVQILRCMRCLEDFEIPVDGEVDLLIQVDDPEHEEERELEEEDLGMLFLDKPEIDTRPILIEQLHLGVPMKPVCREDCRGLCTSCGKDLNAGPCDCQPELDPRWSALLELKKGAAD